MLLPRRHVLRGLLVLAAVLLPAIPSTAAAQGSTEVESVQVSLWPEYDRGDVLVIYRVILPASTSLPAQVRLPIPADAPELTAAAFRAGSGGLLNAPYDRIEGDQADVIEFAAEGTELQIEFYLPLPAVDDLRQFSFTWPGELEAGDFAYEIQQPVGAQEMNVDPAPTSQSTDAQGLTYHLVDLGPLSAADRPEVSFRYRKNTSQLTTEVAPLVGLATPAPAAAFAVDVGGILPWVVLVAGLSLVIGGVVYFLRNRQEDRPARPRHRSTRPSADDDDRVDASPVFCHNCGTQASASDRFCRQCGTALRT